MALRLSEGLGLAGAGARGVFKIELPFVKPIDAMDHSSICPQSVAKHCYGQAPKGEDDCLKVGWF